MFANTPNDILDAGGAPSQPQSMRPEPSFGENIIAQGVSSAMGHGSELGANILGSRELNNQYEAIRKYDPNFADKLPNPGYAALPDIQNGLVTGKPIVGTLASKLAGVVSGGANQNLQDAIKGQQQIEEWRKSHPEATDVPRLADLIGNVKNQQAVVDQEAMEAQQRAKGIDIPVVGKVTGSGLIGGIAASFAPSNPAQALFNIALAGTGGITKDIIANTYGRVAANAAANGVVSAVSQSVLAAPAAEQYGVKRDYKQEAFGVLTNTLLGGILSGVHEGYEHYFPATTVKGMAETKGNVDAAIAKGGDTAEALKTVMAAKTPDEASAIVTNMPLETRLDVLHEVNPNPTSEERGVMNAGERDLVLEKGFKEAGVEYPEGMKQAGEAQKAVESGKPIPETEHKSLEVITAPSGQQPPTLPNNLAGAKPRYGYGSKLFTLGFESDIDKALYITAQKTPSKMDAAYRTFLRQNGFTDEQIRTQGAAIRDKIKGMAKDSEPGHLNIEKSNEPKPVALPKKAVPKTAPLIKKPLQAWLQRMGGVRSGSNLADELKNMGIRKPGLIRTMGRLTDVDNIPHSEWPFGHAPTDKTGHYVDRQHILDELDKEQRGIRGPDEHENDPHYIEHQEEQDRILAAQDAIHEEERNALQETDTVGAREEEMERKYQEIENKALEPEKSLVGRIVEKLTGSGEPKQEELFPGLKAEDKVPIDEEKQTTLQEAVKEIKDNENLFKAMTTCIIGD